jgi:uncharacterized membrane protein YuzA (DUF378 family)
MSEQLKTRKFYPIWQEEKELTWLSTMSQDGWHLKKKGYSTYWFEKGEKTEYIYTIDYKPTTDKDIDEYKAIYNDAGWEFIDGYAGWQYFKILKSSKPNNIYCDVQSKKRRLKKILMLLLSLAGANASIIFINLLINWVGFEKLSAIPLILYVIWGISTVVVLLLLMTSIKLFVELRKLNKSIEE